MRAAVPFSALCGVLPRQQRFSERQAHRLMRPLASIHDQDGKMIVFGTNAVCRKRCLEKRTVDAKHQLRPIYRSKLDNDATLHLRGSRLEQHAGIQIKEDATLPKGTVIVLQLVQFCRRKILFQQTARTILISHHRGELANVFRVREAKTKVRSRTSFRYAKAYLYVANWRWRTDTEPFFATPTPHAIFQTWYNSG